MMDILLSFSEIDAIRERGLRPQVVGCFINNNKVLFVYGKKHGLWQIAQGGIDNQETIPDAFSREMKEELGISFVDQIDKDSLKLIGEDELLFPSSLHGERELKTDDGENIVMKGKKYFFIKAEIKQEKLDISKTEFNDYKWSNYKESVNLCEKIYQRGKREITRNIINILKEKKLIN